MQFTVLAIGRLRSKPCAQLIDDYARRLQRGARLTFVEVPEGRDGDAHAVRDQESRALLARVPDRARLILLDERGLALTSRALAERIRIDQLHGDSHWVLAIGGAFGHGEPLRARADWSLALSAMTLPHELARVVLVEQLYRAMSILSGAPYHKD